MTIRIKEDLRAGGKPFKKDQLVEMPLAPSTDKQALLDLIQMGFAEEVKPDAKATKPNE